jgi:hypothetical protein
MRGSERLTGFMMGMIAIALGFMALTIFIIAISTPRPKNQFPVPPYIPTEPVPAYQTTGPDNLILDPPSGVVDPPKFQGGKAAAPPIPKSHR